ncbi:hypothetical protein [Caballeronia novacaledonica]|uniref:hypothetical protein n=1 Tax=Caballeronia novacaledonica TaxID=1544861 RepID=UPI0011B25321|nr:hypothetical protein [Caballeronia novacaledonica]
MAALTLGGKIARAVIEEKLGLPWGKLTEMCRKTTRKRFNKNSGERVESSPSGLEDWEFAWIVGKGYDKGRGVLTDRFVFEFGLGQLIEYVQLSSGAGLTEGREVEPKDKMKETIKAQVNNRHKANKIFIAGLAHVRRGEVPWSNNGRRKKWANASSEERLASFENWFDAIDRLGCHVVNREGWEDWFERANPAGSMEQFFRHWISAWHPGEAPCPPWIWPEVDYWDAHDALDSDDFLDTLILVTESDMPYSAYHRRCVQPECNGGRAQPVAAETEDDQDWEFGRDVTVDDTDCWLAELSTQAATSKVPWQIAFDALPAEKWRSTGQIPISTG